MQATLKLLNCQRGFLAPKIKDFLPRTLTLSCQFNHENQEQKIHKGIMANIERIQARAEMMKNEEHEFQIGKRHLANMMGEDPDFFDQEDIDRSIEYLMPTSILNKRARPSMKPPNQVHAKEKEAQFNEMGRPFHPFFYCVIPCFYEKLHILACKVHMLDHFSASSNYKQTSNNPNTSIDLLGTRWLTKEELEDLHQETYKEKQYALFIQSFDRLVAHRLAFKEKEFIMQFRKPIKKELSQETNKVLFTDDGRPYMKHSSHCKTACATATVYGHGSGLISINGKDISFFKKLQDREEITFPLIFTNMSDIVDVHLEVDTTLGGSSGQAHACRHAISVCLASMVDQDMHTRMKIAGLLQRDLRRRERKKPGQEGARRKFTWQRR